MSVAEKRSWVVLWTHRPAVRRPPVSWQKQLWHPSNPRVSFSPSGVLTRKRHLRLRSRRPLSKLPQPHPHRPRKSSLNLRSAYRHPQKNQVMKAQERPGSLQRGLAGIHLGVPERLLAASPICGCPRSPWRWVVVYMRCVGLQISEGGGLCWTCFTGVGVGWGALGTLQLKCGQAGQESCSMVLGCNIWPFTAVRMLVTLYFCCSNKAATGLGTVGGAGRVRLTLMLGVWCFEIFQTSFLRTLAST